MLKYIIRRLLEVIPTTFGIIVLTFVLFNVVGGSPAQVILGKNATKESIAAFNHKYGYDLPLPKQFVKFCNDLAHGDFGISTEADEPVLSVLKRGVGPSLSLTVPILFGGTAVGLMLAMLCAPGKSILRNVYSIARGYQDFAKRLQKMGADIQPLSSF